MATQIMLIPRYWVELNRELAHHPELMAALSHYGMHELLEKLGEIAAYCSVLLDGYYMEDNVEHIVVGLTQKLRDRRASNIIVVGGSTDGNIIQ